MHFRKSSAFNSMTEILNWTTFAERFTSLNNLVDICANGANLRVLTVEKNKNKVLITFPKIKLRKWFLAIIIGYSYFVSDFVIYFVRSNFKCDILPKIVWLFHSKKKKKKNKFHLEWLNRFVREFRINFGNLILVQTWIPCHTSGFLKKPI